MVSSRKHRTLCFYIFQSKLPHGSDSCKIGGKADCPTRVPSITSNIGTVFPAGPGKLHVHLTGAHRLVCSLFKVFPPPPSTGASFGPRAESPGLLPQAGAGVGVGGTCPGIHCSFQVSILAGPPKLVLPKLLAPTTRWQMGATLECKVTPISNSHFIHHFCPHASTEHLVHVRQWACCLARGMLR